ncbi:MAG: hypothetical protein WBP63_01780, partial [Silvibacterium sp.]
MKNMVWWRNTLSLSLVLSGLALVAPARAQQVMLPNSNGSNSTFNANGDIQTRPAAAASSGSLTAIPDDFSDLRLTAGVL